jgi:hypothetical protein
MPGKLYLPVALILKYRRDEHSAATPLIVVQMFVAIFLNKFNQ